MSLMRTLPVLEGAKSIVIDEGLEALYARTLINGWMQIWKEKNPKHKIEILLFSDPKSSYDSESGLFTFENVHVRDCYTIDENEIATKDLETFEHILKSFQLKPPDTVIVDCLSSLVLYNGLAISLQFIEKLSKHVPQLICIYRRDFIRNKVPAIETLGTTYIKLEKFTRIRDINKIIYNAKLIHRKFGGSVTCQTETIKQDSESYQINAEKIMAPDAHKSETSTNEPVKVEASFRIEMNAQEMEQRDKTPLPFTFNTTNTSQIFYHPDDADDIDEDDPDDDLCF